MTERIATIDTSDLVRAAGFAELALPIIAEAEEIRDVLGRLADAGVPGAAAAVNCLAAADLTVLETALHEILDGAPIRVQVTR